MIKLRPEWDDYLHTFRKRETDFVFDKFRDSKFKHALELGAGDGYQSKLISAYCEKLISTDLNGDMLPPEDSEKITYQVLDAEKTNEIFADDTFDLIYSSNLLEHLPNIDSAIVNMREILKPDGHMIHVIPSPGWKFFSMLLYLPSIVFFLVESKVLRRKQQTSKNYKGNNLKVETKHKFRWINLFVPKPHGVSKTNIKEFKAFSKNVWETRFKSAGLMVEEIKSGPVSSGYGFGLERSRRILEKLGVTTEYIYILKNNKY